MRDNQNRDLEAAKRYDEMLSRMRAKGRQMSQERFAELVKQYPLPDWTTVEGVLVLRSGSDNHVAVPVTGRKTSARFDILTLEPREFVTQVKKDEVATWLWRTAQRDL